MLARVITGSLEECASLAASRVRKLTRQQALDCLQKACTDLLITDAATGEVLIGCRKVHPQPDWWCACARFRARAR